MASNLLELSFRNKEILKLTSKTGQVKVKKWDKEKKCKVETNELKTWRMQKFSISLGKRGRQPLGFIEVQYWGDKELKEGMLIRKGYFFLKQSKWEVKDPTTFIVKKHAKHELILTDFDCLIKKEDGPVKYAKPKTPEESIKKGLEDYNGEQIFEVEEDEGTITKEDYEDEHFNDTARDHREEVMVNVAETDTQELFKLEDK